LICGSIGEEWDGMMDYNAPCSISARKFVRSRWTYL